MYGHSATHQTMARRPTALDSTTPNCAQASLAETARPVRGQLGPQQNRGNACPAPLAGALRSSPAECGEEQRAGLLLWARSTTAHSSELLTLRLRTASEPSAAQPACTSPATDRSSLFSRSATGSSRTCASFGHRACPFQRAPTPNKGPLRPHCGCCPCSGSSVTQRLSTKHESFNSIHPLDMELAVHPTHALDPVTRTFTSGKVSPTWRHTVQPYPGPLPSK